jgi:hypothetical protein
MTMSLTDEEITTLSNAANADEWNAECDAFKERRSGRYPHDWWERVQRSGMAHRVSSSWSALKSSK